MEPITTTPGGTTDRAIVGVFDDRSAAERAVEALYGAGFSDQHIGFVIRGADDVRGGMIVDAEGTKDGKGAVTGAVTGGMLGGILAAAIAVLIPGVGPVVAGGVMAAFFGGAIAGTAVGGIFGAMQGLGVSEDEAKYYEKEFQSGRAIVAVKAGARASDAAAILRKHGGYDLQNRPIADVHHSVGVEGDAARHPEIARHLLVRAIVRHPIDGPVEAARHVQGSVRTEGH